MPHCIARIFEPLLGLMWPAPGRHRRPPAADLTVEASTCSPARLPAHQVVRGEEIGLVRPYLVAHERRQAQKRQARRRTLWLAVRGTGIGPLPIHGVEGTV